MPIASAPTRPDDALVNPLDQLRGTVYRFVLLDGLLAAGLFLAAAFWAGLALDYGLFRLTTFDWVLDAPWTVRLVALLAVTLALVGLVASRLVVRLRTQFSYPSLALVLERRFPAVLGDRLITAVELADVEMQRGYGYSAEMIRATIDDARERVAGLPVETVFNWRRLRRRAWLLGGLVVGGVLAVYAGAALLGGPASLQGFARRFADVVIVYAERDLLLQNAAWPRAAHLELVGFPGDELRVGKDAAAPRVRVRAFRWVIADRDAVHGWRPLRWADVTPDFLGRALPTLPADAAGGDVDRFEGSPDMRPFFARLEELAAKPRMSRTLRRLDIPEAVTLAYSGPKTSGGLSLTREANNEFVGEVSGLKESVRFTVRGADFVTRPRAITLVPPPMFAKLARTEYQPAYLFHPPPVKDAGRQEFADLRGLRQLVGEKPLSLTGDRSASAVVQGTEFVLAGAADKPLKAVQVRPKVGKIPGLPAGSPGPLTVAPTGPDRDSFALAFRGADRPAGNLEFELVLTDEDDVSTTRGILVQVTEDQPPQVELAVDVLRKQGNSYLVTPVCRVPFQTQSSVKDDTALSKVEFAYTYAQVETQVVVGVQAQALAGVWGGVPLVPGIAAAVTPAAGAALTQVMTRPERKVSGAYPLPKFADAFRELGPDTPAGLAQKLNAPADADRPRVVREVKFNNQDLDAFDLGRAIPALLAKEPGAVQPRFRVEVNLVATDANVETGPKTGQNLEPVRLTVVSEAELLAEMSKDEEAQSAKLDEVLKRLRAAQTVLNQTAERLAPTAPPPDVLENARIAAENVAQEIAKARDLTGTVVGEFRNLHREAGFNGLREEVLAGYAKLIAALDGVVQGEFQAAEDAHRAVQQALAAARRPENALVAADRDALARLIDRLRGVREQLGEAVSLSKLRDNLRKLIDDEKESGRVLEAIYKGLISDLDLPKIREIPVVEVSRGQKVLVKHAIEWNAFTGSDFSVRIDGPKDGTVRFPVALKVADDKNVLEYEVTAGDKAGDYRLTVVPSAGKPVDVTVRIK